MTTGHQLTFVAGPRRAKTIRAQLEGLGVHVSDTILDRKETLIRAIYVHPAGDDRNLTRMRAGLDAARAVARKGEFRRMEFVTVDD